VAGKPEDGGLRERAPEKGHIVMYPCIHPMRTPYGPTAENTVFIDTDHTEAEKG